MIMRPIPTRRQDTRGTVTLKTLPSMRLFTKQDEDRSHRDVLQSSVGGIALVLCAEEICWRKQGRFQRTKHVDNRTKE